MMLLKVSGPVKQNKRAVNHCNLKTGVINIYALHVKDLSYTYRAGNRPALENITFKVAAGETLGVVGLNGSGKTTLSYCLCGIIPHYFYGTMTGTVTVKDMDTRKTPLLQLTDEVGIVLQDPNVQLLMPTVEDDIAFGLENRKLQPEIIRGKIEQVLELTGTTHLRHENPNRLSGGEKQLIALATVLAMDPSIIVFDESLSMLDQAGTEKIIRVMQLLKKRGTTMVLIDHTGKGHLVYDKISILEEGKIIRRGPRDQILADRQFLLDHKLLSTWEG